MILETQTRVIKEITDVAKGTFGIITPFATVLVNFFTKTKNTLYNRPYDLPPETQEDLENIGIPTIRTVIEGLQAFFKGTEFSIPLSKLGVAYEASATFRNNPSAFINDAQSQESQPKARGEAAQGR